VFLRVMAAFALAMLHVRGTPEEISEKWAQRTAGATEDYRRGISRVSQAPGQAAAAKRAKWQQNVQQSGDKWEAGVRRVSLNEWQEAAGGEGATRFASGVQAKKGKMASFQREFIPHLERGQEAVKRMPDTSFEDRINKMVAMARHNRSFRRGGPSAGA
jgi:hypothetical protein